MSFQLPKPSLRSVIKPIKHPARFDIELTPLRIAGIYFLFGMAFLYLSDVLFVRYLTEPLLSQVQALKGAVEVFLTAGLIFVLTWQSQRQLRETNSELREQSNLVSVLSRVLRHNLRNDLNVVRGHLTMLAEDVSDSDRVDNTPVRKIDELVELADTARQIESIASADAERQPVELSTLVENVIEEVQANYPEASFSIERSGDVYVEVYPTIRTVLQELIENAAKHSGDSPTVTIAIEQASDTTQIEVIDTGPGLPTQEQEVLREGGETPLIHGSGLALWLSNWIVTSHGGSIQTEVNDGGTRVSVSLPHISPPSEFEASETLLGRFHREQDRFEAVFDESFDGMVIADNDGRYLDVNAEAVELFGTPPEDLIGRRISNFAAEEFDFAQAWDQFLEQGQQQGEFTVTRPDGSKRIAEYSATAEIVPGQHLVILRDVTKRVETEAAIQETTQQLQAIVTASPEAIITLDADGAISRWNEAAEEIFGYPADEVIGKPIQSLDLHADGQGARFEERFKRTLDGEQFSGLEVARQTKAGDEVHLSISTAPMRDEAGEIDGIMAVARDVSSRVELERRYEALRDGYPDLCFIIDEDGVYQDVLKSPTSAEQLYAEPEKFLGSSIDDVLPPDLAERSLKAIGRSVETGEQQVFEYELDLPPGTRRFEARTALLSDTLSSKRLVSVATRDITERAGRDGLAQPA